MKAFIDLGSFHGSIIRKFIASPQYSPDFIIHAFESNPKIGQDIFWTYPQGVKTHTEAAWIHDGEIEFYINSERPIKVQGSSVYKEKTTGGLDKEHPLKIRCIDFSRWLACHFTLNDDVIVKMNIEGAEYPVLSKLIYDGNVNLIRKLYLRRHWHKIGIAQSVDTELMENLAKYKGLQIFNNYEF
jgi:FkbM family methyltransferase